uniref:C2H2-type domain-containing protein n=1 Tax=Megaselia scalaris TaxID=36166 RepID=T1GE90_MEGSC
MSLLSEQESLYKETYSSFLSPRRNDLRPKTPPPPSIRSSGNNYHNYHNHRGSRNDSSYRNSFSPTSASRKRQSQRNVASYRNSTRLRPNSIRDSDSRRPKGIIRRKVIVSSSRKIHSMRNERTRMIRLARIKRNKDSLKIKNNASSKKSKEDHSDDDHSENKRNSSNNECENEDKKSSSKKNGQDLNCKDKEVKEGDEKSSEDKSKEGNNEEDSSESRRNRSSKRESISPERNNKPFIKLICVHCRIKCRTFSEYQSHLYSRTHRIAMRRVGVRQKAQLSRMRLEQRNVQRDLEENAKEDLGDQQYCLLCRLNYKTGKAKHQLSDHHKIMKKFLMPYCSTCHIAFKSPIVYQSHRCSLEHIKRKARDNKSDSEDSGSEIK